MGSTGIDLLGVDIDVDCPRCTYPIWVRLVEVAAQVAVPCPCCRATIWLHDQDGSVRNANETIERELNDLMKNLGF